MIDKKIKKIIVARNCPYCRGEKNPDYKNIEELEKYTTDRGKIIPSSRNGLCLKHQRELAIAIKRARFLALLPFITRV